MILRRPLRFHLALALLAAASPVFAQTEPMHPILTTDAITSKSRRA